jgi:hypothetical protein
MGTAQTPVANGSAGIYMIRASPSRGECQVWALLGAKSLAMCGSAESAGDAIASDLGGCDHVSPGARG